MEKLDDLILRMDRLIGLLPSLILKNTEAGALDALALVDLRIVGQGKDASGADFEDYTPEYKARKQKLGRYRGKVDFTLSGQMLASTTTGFERIGPTSKTVNGGRARITFDGRDEETKNKLAGNDKYRPGFLNPSKQEMETVTIGANKNMERDVAQILGAK